MPRNAKQLAGVALLVMRLTKGRVGPVGVIALVVLAMLYTAVVQPLAKSTFGVSLPTINEPAQQTPRDRSPSPTAVPTPSVDLDSLRDVLTPAGRGAYVSEAGLRYTRGSEHGHRVLHVLGHTRDEPDRVGSHGVFDNADPSAVIRLIDEAYTQAQSGRRTRTKREEGRVVYNVDLGRRIGYVGGQSGARRGNPAAESMRLVVQDDRLITAFPTKQ